MNIEQIRTHIDYLIKKSGKPYRALSLQIGKNEAYLHQFITKGSPLRLPETQRRKLAELLDVDEQELTDIKLPKMLYPHSKHTESALIEMIYLHQTEQETLGFLSLPKTDFTNITSSEPYMVKMIRVDGDSMTPTIKDGDFVLADFSQTTLLSDGLYLINTGTQISIKRIQQTTPKEAMIISDNPNYKPISLSVKKLHIVAKVIYAFKAEKLG